MFQLMAQSIFDVFKNCSNAIKKQAATPDMCWRLLNKHRRAAVLGFFAVYPCLHDFWLCAVVELHNYSNGELRVVLYYNKLGATSGVAIVLQKSNKPKDSITFCHDISCVFSQRGVDVCYARTITHIRSVATRYGLYKTSGPLNSSLLEFKNIRDALRVVRKSARWYNLNFLTPKFLFSWNVLYTNKLSQARGSKRRCVLFNKGLRLRLLAKAGKHFFANNWMNLRRYRIRHWLRVSKLWSRGKKQRYRFKMRRLLFRFRPRFLQIMKKPRRRRKGSLFIKRAHEVTGILWQVVVFRYLSDHRGLSKYFGKLYNLAIVAQKQLSSCVYAPLYLDTQSAMDKMSHFSIDSLYGHATFDIFCSSFSFYWKKRVQQQLSSWVLRSVAVASCGSSAQPLILKERVLHNRTYDVAAFTAKFGRTSRRMLHKRPRQIKFKNEYRPLFRKLRASFQRTWDLKFKYQWRLTRFLARLRYLNNFLYTSIYNYSMASVLYHCNFFQSRTAAVAACQCGFFFLNSSRQHNPMMQVQVGDVLQAAINYPMYAAIMQSFSYRNLLFFRVFYHLRSLGLLSNSMWLQQADIVHVARDGFVKPGKFKIPRRKLANFVNNLVDIPPQYEVDFLTLSVYIINIADVRSTNHHFLARDLSLGYFRMLNWKYIT